MSPLGRRRPLPRAPEAGEPIGVLLVPCVVEEYEFANHAQELLAIPRVIAMEPGRASAPGLLGEAVAPRLVRRLKLPGTPALIVLYGPAQYGLARALLGRWPKAELWYVRAEPPVVDEDGRPLPGLVAADNLARMRAAGVVVATRDGSPWEEAGALQARLHELGIISDRPFTPKTRPR